MKRRYRYALNVLSIGLLVFALYLNFVRKESDEMPGVNKDSSSKSSPVTVKKSTSLSVTTPAEILVIK